MTRSSNRPLGFWPIGAFFIFGSAAASLAAVTLLWPGTVLDKAWKLNPTGHAGLSAFGPWIGVAFVPLAIALVLAAIGWIKRRRWGLFVGVGVVAVNLTGDVLHLAAGDHKSGIGVVIAGLLLFYMLSSTGPDLFRSKHHPPQERPSVATLYDYFPPNNAAIRFFISAGETSSMWVPIFHLYPNGSSTEPDRSP